MFSSIDHGISHGFPFAALAASCAFAALMDLVRGRIPNWFTLPFLASGLGLSLAQGGWLSLGDALLGAVAGLFFYGWMFWLGHMGGGDVKFLMAVGAWGGLLFAAEVALFAVLVGGALAATLLLARGRLTPFARKLHRFLLSLLVKDLALELPKVDRGHTMPYGIPIAIAAVWTAHSHPLVRLFEEMGVRPWF